MFFNFNKDYMHNILRSSMMHRRFLLAIVLIAGIVSVGVGLVFPNSIAESPEMKTVSSLNDGQSTKYYYDSETGMYKVKAGGGGGRIIVMNYYPQNLEIKVGDSVKFYNPTTVLEPHTVTFIQDNKFVPTLEGTYLVTDPNSIQVLPNEMNSEPLIVPLDEQSKAIVAINARGFFPYVIDSEEVATNLGPNAIYSMDGSEKYVSSGWLIPKSYVGEIPGASDSFTVTFEKSGKFPYICVLHPWMSGQIIVTE